MSQPSEVSADTLEFGAALKRFRESRRLSVDEMGQLLKVSGNYVYTLERRIHEPSPRVRADFAALTTSANIFAVTTCVGERLRDIPIISWAQAGRATSYEEMPFDWQDTTQSLCPDAEAYAIRLVGDSMEPHHHAGDIVEAMPNCAPHHNCLVLAKLMVDDGVLFKRFTVAARRPQQFRLSSYNRRYPSQVFTWEDVHWVHPVYTATQRIGRVH